MVIVQMILHTRFVYICNWFKRFRGGNSHLRDESRPAATNTDFIKAMFAENPRYSVPEIVDAANISKETVYNHFLINFDGICEWNVKFGLRSY